MKKTVKIILSSLFVLLFLVSYAQEDAKVETKEKRKEEKAKIKKEKEAKEAADWLVYQKLAEDQKFVVVFDKIGINVVSKRLNFLYANEDDIILQFETNTYLSENGLGGRTINGTISNYKYKPPKNDNKPIFINFDITSKFDQKNFNISITIYSGGVTLISMGGGLSSIHGVFLPIEEANINLGVDMRN
jgi:hypothetical protein